MIKKRILKIVSAILVTSILAGTFASCSSKPKKETEPVFYKEYSVKDKAHIVPAELANDASYMGKAGDSIEITFDEPTKVNTVVLMEDGDNVSDFQIDIKEKDEEEFETIYKQDKISYFRYCAFEDEEIVALKITINKTRDGDLGAFTLKGIDVLNAVHNRKDFEVRSYAVVGSMLSEESIDPKHLDTITDMILFGALVFDEEGHIKENEFELDGKKITGKEALNIVIENIKKAVSMSENKTMPRLYINLLGPDGDVDTKEKKHNVVFKKYKDTFIKEINEVIEEFQVDGIYFDYEYPYKKSGWNAFSKFLVSLKAGLSEGKKIGLALPPWGMTINDKAKKATDNYELMTYDMFDNDGYHATFESATNGVKYLNEWGLALDKSTIGIPFYGRPLDKAPLWTSYAQSYEEQGKFGNIASAVMDFTVEENGEQVSKKAQPRYLNSYQMVYDKTAYALDCGLKGVMIWHYACDVKVDTGLSLFDAIGEAIEDRKA